MRLASAFAPILAVLCLVAAMLAPALPARADSATEKLVVATAKGPVTFEVEVMSNDEDRAKGLMFRRYMPEDRGMLFDFKEPQPVSFWMKNTYLSLDMLFIRKDGSIARIVEEAEPLSTRTIPSGEPVLGVLELNAGAAQRHGIKVGDKVQHALFK